MVRYILTQKALCDLSDIWNYTYDKWSENQADKYYQMLIKSIQLISENPDVGKKYDSIKKELYGIKVGRHIIFYQKSELEKTKIEIIRILHESMDLKNKINE